MSNLYVLRLASGKYYVGKTDNVDARFASHLSGKGSAWTAKYKPITIVETRKVASEHDENNVTKDLMKKYGIDNVRGGAYAQVTLPADIKTMLQHELRSNDDSCYKCGNRGHFARNCPETDLDDEEVWTCDHCGSEFDTEAKAVRHESTCRRRPPPRVASRPAGVCYRCGRPGHYSPECYARRHVNGYEIDDDESDD